MSVSSSRTRAGGAGGLGAGLGVATARAYHSLLTGPQLQAKVLPPVREALAHLYSPTHPHPTSTAHPVIVGVRDPSAPYAQIATIGLNRVSRAAHGADRIGRLAAALRR